MTTAIILIAVIVLAALLLLFIVWRVRSGRFRPSTDKQRQQNELNADLEETGFAYELKGDYFYSLMDCWQREVGYCRLYDEAAPLFNMIMDCEPVTFSYAGKRWLIELWKGQYGITTGGEIGIYNTDRVDIDTDKFKGTFYENIPDNEMLKMSFVLRRNGKTILRRSAVHWWLTGFKLGTFSETDTLTMDAKIVFPTAEMRNAFTAALRNMGYSKREFSVRQRAVSIHYTAPHSPQTESRNRASEALVQQTNSNNCKLYKFATGKYSDTLDKLEYVKAMMPELYSIFVKSLYARGIYESFEWIKDWLAGRHPEPGPVPPKPPIPPCPLPPIPPCPLPPISPCPPPEPPAPPCPPPKPPVPPCPPPKPPVPPCPLPRPPVSPCPPPEPQNQPYDPCGRPCRPDNSCRQRTPCCPNRHCGPCWPNHSNFCNSGRPDNIGKAECFPEDVSSETDSPDGTEV